MLWISKVEERGCTDPRNIISCNWRYHEWNNIPRQEIRRIDISMHRRCLTILNKSGRQTQNWLWKFNSIPSVVQRITQSQCCYYPDLKKTINTKQLYLIVFTKHCFVSITFDALTTNDSDYTLLVLFRIIKTNFLAK